MFGKMKQLPPKGDPPGFITSIEPLVVDIGEDIHFEAKVKGQNVELTWQKQNEELKSGDRVTIKFDRGIASLDIKSATMEDSANYTLTAKNEFGWKSATASCLVKGQASASTLIVTGKNQQVNDEDLGPTEGPSFSMRPQNITCIDGGSCLIEFTINHDVMPEIRFIKGKREIKPGKKVQFDIDSASKTIRITINQLKFADEGKYSIQLLNPDGHSNHDASFNIYVKDPKDSNLDFRSLLKHKDYKKRGSGEDDPDWGKLKHREKESSQEEGIDWPDLKHREKKKPVVPSFVSPLKDITVEEGVDKEVILEAEFSVKNVRTAKWQRNRMEVFKGSKDEIIQEGFFHKLHIKKLGPKDSGNYTLSCDGVVTSCNLFIKAKRKEYKFGKKLRESYTWKEGKEAELVCDVGESQQDVVWKKNGVEITSESNLISIHQSGTSCILKVSAAQLDMAGTYECEVYKDVTSCKVTVDEMDYEFVQKLSEHEVLQNDDAELVVLVNHERAKVRWFRGATESSRKEIFKSEKYELVTNKLHRTLRIKNCAKADTDTYWCLVGDQQCSAPLAVASDVRFIERLSPSLMAVEKHQAVLETLVENPHKKEVCWLKDGKPVTDKRYQIKGDLVLNMLGSGQMDKQNWKGAKESNLYKYLLIIESCEKVDSGSFTCRVGDEESVGTFTVTESLAPPVLDMSLLLEMITVRVSKRLHLSIPYKAKPEPTVSWMFQGSSILSHMITSQTSSLIEFTIESASRTDSGVYRIKAVNQCGEFERDINVLVIDKAGKVEGLTVGEVWADNVFLKWQPPKDDGGYEISYYIVEMMDVKGGSWSKVGQCKETEFRVKKLTENAKYRFRVCAHTLDGQGQWAELDNDVTARDPYDPPSGPESVTVEDFTYHSAKLTWGPPKTDGGSPVNKYIVEMKTASESSWTEVGNTARCGYTIEQLKEETEYQFRVIAVNKMGSSVPSQTSGSILTKKKLRAPRLDTRDWSDLIKKKGQSFNLTCQYSGVPQPTIEWYKMDEPVDPKYITTTDKETSIFVEDLVRQNRGVHKVIAKNELGEAWASIDLVVLAPPCRPEGPLEVSEIFAESCKLSWRHPKDDGGNEILGYRVEKLDKKTGKWEKVKSLNYPTTSFTVPKLKKGSSYEFRVFAENVHGDSEPLVSDGPVTAENPFSVADAPDKPELVDSDRTFIEIEWLAPYDGGSPVLGYIVERKEVTKAKGVNNSWVVLTRTPTKDIYYHDTKVKPMKTYEYRVTAVNAAGNSNPSPSTGTIQARPMAEAPRIDMSSLFGARDMKVRSGEPLKITLGMSGCPNPVVEWRNNDNVITPNDRVKLEQDDESITLSIDKSNRSDGGSYTIKAVNKHGESSESLNVIVLDSPTAPEGPLEITNVFADRCTLTWKAPRDICGALVTDYVIEVDEGCVGNWVERMCTVNGTSAVVKGLKEGKRYKCRVSAVNVYGRSEPLEGDTITAKNPFDRPSAPGNPAITTFDEFSTSLSWKPPSSDGGNPIQGYQVERKEKGGEWQIMTQDLVTDTKCTLPCSKGKTYDFRVAAVNDGGLGDWSKTVGPHLCRENIDPAGAPGTPSIDKITPTSVDLSWKRPTDDGGALNGYSIEALKEGEKEWVEVATTMEMVTSTTVKGLQTGATYSFRVRGENVAGLGEPSKPTKPVVVEEQPCLTTFDMDGIKDVVAKAGTTLRIEVPITKAHPVPSVLWSVNGESIDDRAVSNVTKTEALLTIPKCRRSDTGRYTGSFTNSSGTAEVSLKATVLDAPSAPKGPITFKDMMGESCVLVWKAPEDNGGSEITNYIIEKRISGTPKWSKVTSFIRNPHCSVKNLDIGKEYDFRVCAENEFGVSEPLLTSDPILARHPFNKPGKPGAPKSTDTSLSSISLKWDPPRNDGGNPIAGYQIEKKLKSDENWVKCSRSAIADTQFTASNLIPNKEYEFRVAALNEAGLSEWSDSSDLIEAKNPEVEPTIDDSLIQRTVNAEVGKEFKVSIPFKGGPIKAADFSVNGSPIEKSDRCVVKILDGEVVLLVKSAVKADHGTYGVTLTNSKGQAVTSLKVNVRGAPGMPGGPLEVSDVTEESCTLTWRAPVEDGGSSVTHYIIEKKDKTSNTDWEPAQKFCRTTSHQISDLTDGHSYEFRVSACNDYGVSKPLLTDRETKIQPQYVKADNPSKVALVDMTKNSVTLSWARPNSDGGDPIQGYIIEYKKAGDHWAPFNRKPISDLTAKVTDLEYEEYEFRVRAKNKAGLSEHSNPLKVQVKPEFTTAGKPSQPVVDECGRNFVSMTWQAPKSDGGRAISGYNIEARQGFDGPWVKVNDFPVRNTSFTATQLPQNVSYEFRVSAVNKAGSGQPSDPTASVTPRDPDADLLPEFDKKFGDVSTSVGETVKIVAQFSGKPKRVQWFHRGIEIDHGGRYQIVMEENRCVLIINDVQEGDTGDIQCVISNHNGSETCSAKLKANAAPYLTSSIGTQNVSLGDSHKIKLSLGGTGPFTYKVLRNGHAIPESDKRVRISGNDDTFKLSIAEIIREDNADWSIEIKNDVGTTNLPFNMRVKAPPCACRGPLKVSDITSSSANLSWLPPSNNGGYKVTHYLIERQEVGKGYWTTVSSQGCTDPEFTVQGLTADKEYLFRVSAVNSNGAGDYLTASNPIVARYPFDKPGAPGAPVVDEVGGDFVNLSWDKGSDGGGRILGYIIEKREASAERWTRVNHELVKTLSYNIINLIEDNSYYFRVIAVNLAGESKPSDESGRIVVKDPKAASLPVFKSQLANVETIQGKKIEFECVVETSPHPDVSWFKGSRELEDNHRVTISSEGDRYSLSILDAQGEDEDDYCIRVSTAAGTRQSRAKVTVRCAPKILLPSRFESATAFEKGETIVLKIPFLGNPKPSFTWYKNGDAIKDESRCRQEISKRHVSLTVKSANKADGGLYRLSLENPLGTDSSSMEFTVNDTPGAPHSLVVEHGSGSDVTLSWLAPHDDGGSTITDFLVERKESDGDKWIKVNTTRSKSLLIQSLSIGKSYELRVTASNLYGYGSPSHSVPVSIDADKVKSRSVAVDSVRGKKIQVDDYDKFYKDIWSHGKAFPADLKGDKVEDYYEILEELGSGAFGVVYRCIERSTGRVFVAKFVDTSNLAEKQAIRNEISVMNQLHHRKLIRLHDAFEDKHEMCLILEFLSGGELFDRIADENYKMSEGEVVKYIRQVCEALRYMHELSIVHLDIKPENIICETKNSASIKLIDFGLACKLDPNVPVKVSRATAEFAAPEIVANAPVGFYTDMWSVGVLAYVLLSGLSPFAGDNDEETLHNVSRCDWEFDSENFSSVSGQAKDFITRLLLKTGSNRMTVHEALEHEWLKSDLPGLDKRISGNRYLGVRTRIHEKYGIDINSRLPAIGIVSNFSSIRKLRMNEYHIYVVEFDRREAAPRFIVKPGSSVVPENSTVHFHAAVIAASDPIVNWYFGDVQLTQSVKYMQKYSGKTYGLKVSRVRKSEDEGTYSVVATNSFGKCETSCKLGIVAEAPIEIPKTELNISTRKVVLKEVELPVFERKPFFSFPLRERYIQEKGTFKLTATIDADVLPVPQIQWLKDGKDISASGKYSISYSSGRCSLEVSEAHLSDAGKYTCIATNKLGEAECSCQVHVNESVRTSGSRRAASAQPGARSHMTSSAGISLRTRRGSGSGLASSGLHGSSGSESMQYSRSVDSYGVRGDYPSSGGYQRSVSSHSYQRSSQDVGGQRAAYGGASIAHSSGNLGYHSSSLGNRQTSLDADYENILGEYLGSSHAKNSSTSSTTRSTEQIGNSVMTSTRTVMKTSSVLEM
ncbi:twitchin-like [Watersipora subatra]|uniref:twitchin-like n=1 Tax=Watersipora subatra TaxID=2589382 RepID=UPI00355BD01B